MKVKIEVDDHPQGVACLASKQDLEELKEFIMDEIKTFTDEQDALNARQATAIAGLSGDVARLTARVAELEAGGGGGVTPEEKAKLVELTATARANTETLEALDALTPPPVVVEPPVRSRIR